MTDLSDYLLHGFDLFGTVVFAMGGALVARKERDNWFVAIVYAALTALGGGAFAICYWDDTLFFGCDRRCI